MRPWLQLVPLLALLPSSTAQLEPPDTTAFASSLDSANSSLLWGTYRPGLYFGLRPRLPSTLMTGLMWFGVGDYQSYSKPRHECDQRDGLTYSFAEHDGRSAAKQVLNDKENNVRLTVRWIKVAGGAEGGSWAMRIEGEPIEDGEYLPRRPHKLSRISLINYFGNDGLLSYLELGNKLDKSGLESPVVLKGSTPGLGGYRIRIEDHKTNEALYPGPHVSDFGDKLERTQYMALGVPAGMVWQAKSGSLARQLSPPQLLKPYGQNSPPDPAILFTLPNVVQHNAGLYAVQRAYQGRWGVDIFFDSDASPSGLDYDSLSVALGAASIAYQERFAALFPAISTLPERQQAFARAITANLVGGIGYFYGPSLVDRTHSQEWDAEADASNPPALNAQATEPMELFTATPSRSFFPRGFYWDEGFHLALIGAWDNDLGLEIFRSWMQLADEDGWIAREQILGEEARSRVPEAFQTQYPAYGNPPTLIMGLTGFISRLRDSGVSLSAFDDSLPSSSSDLSADPTALASLHLKSPTLAASFLRGVYPKLKSHYEWFRRTQRGEIRAYGRRARSGREAYRWRGRTADHVLTSGLDDFPRAVPPHAGELHVDLASWMAFFSRTMRDVADFLGEEDDVDDFDEQFEAIVGNIDDLHWSDEQQMYCDASVDDDDESYHVCNAGYVSLFPFLLSLLPPSSPHLGATLELLRDEAHLWSPYGLLSLSKAHPLFGKGENYWRGPIWIQMNYLALAALNNYAKEPGPYQVRAAEIYAELRNNVISNVFQEWERTGTVWEQYNAATGQGQRSDPFTGWTSLVTLSAPPLSS
ncbi:glycoside hydrolase family 63 protein, partial [Rhodotorula graminis WP1]